MAVRMSIGTGNFLTAGTWGLIDSTSYNNTETTTTALTTSYQASSGFTPGAITIDGFALKLSVRTGTTGTISVHVAIAGVEVPGTLVTIDVADLPVSATADLNGGWVFFKFASSVLLVGATVYTVEAKTSSATQVSLFSTATTNWARALRTTTTGAPAAGDDLIVTGEYTGQGTSNSFTVTMNETATTDYGGNSSSLILPALAICSKGTLSYGTSGSTNYILKISGNVIVYSGGTLNIGTTGSPIPRTSTAKLNLDCTSSGAFGIRIRGYGTFNSQGLSRTSGKNIVACKLNSDAAANATSLGVDTDTGWLDNDKIGVGSTTRTASQCEAGTLNGDAGSSSMTVDGFAGTAGGVLNAHSGTSPTQGEVILLTRNVQIFGQTSSNGFTFQASGPNVAIDIDWTEMYWITASNCFSLFYTPNGSFDMQYSSVHDMASAGINFTTGIASGCTLVCSHNTFYNHDTTFAVASGVTTAVWTMTDNVHMLTGGVSIQIPTFGTSPSTFTYITIVGTQSFAGLTLTGTSDLSTLQINNINIHSGTTFGFALNGITPMGVLDNITVWRNSGIGLRVTATVDFSMSNLVAFGNTTSNLTALGSPVKMTLINPAVHADTTFATTNGVDLSASRLVDITIFNGNIGAAAGIKAAHTNDFVLNTTLPSLINIRLVNTKLGSTNEFSSVAFFSNSSQISSQSHDQTAGNDFTLKRYGGVYHEVTTVHTGSHSVKLTPNSSSNKLESPSFFVAVASGQAITPTLYVYEDGSYNGARSRLILKRNDSIGVTSDTVIDTATSASDAAWEGLTGTTGAASADGVMEFVIDCDGTAGNLFVDSFSVA